MAEFKLGNKAVELYRYTLQVTRPVADEKVDAKDVAKVMKTIARADTIEEMRELLLKTADRLDKKPGRPRFPKSESFGMIADLRGAARNIVRGVHAANETIFIENPEERLKEIKGKFIMSINDVPEIRHIFRFFYIQEVKTRYTIATKETGQSKQAKELLIGNVDLRLL